MISYKKYYDTHSRRRARFSKKYSAEEALKLSKSIDGKIKLFEDYYRGWFLVPLKKTLREGTALIATSVLFSFCDVIEQFKRGEKSNAKTTGEFTKKILRNIYENKIFKKSTSEIMTKTIDSFIETIYTTLRNGLHHDLSTRNINIQLSKSLATMYSLDKDNNIKELWFNPSHFLNAVEDEFDEYANQLRQKTNAASILNFERMFYQFFVFDR